MKAVLELSQAKLQQTFGLAWFSNSQFPAYAAKSGILSSKGMRSELSWDVDFPLGKNLDASLRNAFSRKHSSLQSPVWVARNILYLSYKPKDTRITLQLSRYNRELIAYADSTYLATLPVHYRCNIRINQSLNKHLEASLAYRYYYEDQLSKRGAPTQTAIIRVVSRLFNLFLDILFRLVLACIRWISMVYLCCPHHRNCGDLHTVRWSFFANMAAFEEERCLWGIKLKE